MSCFLDFFYLFFPRTCLICNNSLHKHENFICKSCLNELPRSYFYKMKDNPVDQIFWGRVNIEKATCFLNYSKDNMAKDILYEIKYKGKKDLATELGLLFGKELKLCNYFEDIECIVPVPIHRLKERNRGYNQSDYLAYGLAYVYGVPVVKNVLHKISHNTTQTNKNRFDRWLNVENVYHVTGEEELIGKSILLVDDVVTTGATLEACAKKLLEIRDTKVSIATIAYANR